MANIETCNIASRLGRWADEKPDSPAIVEIFSGKQKTFKELENEGEFEDAVDKLTPNDSIFYSIGTSCIFAFVMLSIAGWFFCRKDL